MKAQFEVQWTETVGGRTSYVGGFSDWTEAATARRHVRYLCAEGSAA